MPGEPSEFEFFCRVAEAQRRLDAGYAHLPPSPEPVLNGAAAAILAEAAERMHDNYPYAHPLYAGQMLKPPHPIARAAYTLAMSVNPNNHALDGGRASSAMEHEAVAELARMFGWVGGPERRTPYLGHLSSSGTFANLEALWVADQVAPGGMVVASDQAHYTHPRICSVLGLPFRTIASDASGRMDMAALERTLDAEPVGTVVATLGTTAVGAVDPLHAILRLQSRYGFRVHVDAAYGGFFMLARTLEGESRAAYDSVGGADSLVVDPHKHGLQPYGCGAVLFRDAGVGRFYRHDSPYTYFSSKELHLGEVSLECSRAGAAAVALWATQRLLPYTVGGEFAVGLESCREAALALHARLAGDARFVLPLAPPQLDIVFWAVRGEGVGESSRRAQAIFDESARRDLHLALARLPVRFFPAGLWADAAEEGGRGESSVTCLRSVQMKPEHLAWGMEIWARLDAAATAALHFPPHAAG
ncbi:MAG: aminotransferase class I/II-fold pyridoxal phosphate-dependent enzyme [Acidobacteriota bacterium]|nr:aminotransferase class I/II-fold pyridoxal phosphate-dependent enzyme [Acidobacteriota bacterium]